MIWNPREMSNVAELGSYRPEKYWADLQEQAVPLHILSTVIIKTNMVDEVSAYEIITIQESHPLT